MGSLFLFLFLLDSFDWVIFLLFVPRGITQNILQAYYFRRPINLISKSTPCPNQTLSSAIPFPVSSYSFLSVVVSIHHVLFQISSAICICRLQGDQDSVNFTCFTVCLTLIYVHQWMWIKQLYAYVYIYIYLCLNWLGKFLPVHHRYSLIDDQWEKKVPISGLHT